MMRRAQALGEFLYDFVIGDDPWIAAAVAFALGTTAVLSDTGVATWWVLPVAVGAVLSLSLHRVTRR